MDPKEIYTKLFNEDSRLNRSNASKVEYLTTLKYLQEYLKPNDKILDLGAGTGIYSIELAKQGYDVTAVELVEENLECLIGKITKDMKITPILGNALDLSCFSNDSFDVVLNMGPLYHLPNEDDRIKAIQETMRVLKKGGFAFFAYINNDMVFITEALSYNPNFLLDNNNRYYNRSNFKLSDEVFTILPIDYFRSLMKKLGIVEEKQIAQDGFSELLEDKINALSEEKFYEWLRFHYHTCEKPEFLGSSHHILFITKKEV